MITTNTPDALLLSLVQHFTRAEHDKAAVLFDVDAGFWCNDASLAVGSGPMGYWELVDMLLVQFSSPALDIVRVMVENDHVASGELLCRATLRATGRPVRVAVRLTLDISGGVICGALITISDAELRRYEDQKSPPLVVH